MIKDNSYRPEIDGLRAIAVLSVIFYHYKLNFFPFDIFKGGYLGVDIFFVISGYLISKILITEFKKKKKYIYLKCLERRERRILPALLFLLFFTSIFSYLFLSPENFQNYFKSLISTIFFYSNFFFHFSSIEYGAIEGSFEPLLHTWSLSIEEQFYLFYPIFLLIILKKQKVYKYLILIAILVSFIAAEYLSRNHSSLNFYLFITRAWEFLFGFLVYSWQKNIKYSYLAILGIFLILFSIFFINDKVLHPSFLTIIPVLGTFLVLTYISTDTILFNILSSRLLTFVGKISYSLYLWHFPVFVYVNSMYLFKNINFILFLIPVIMISSFSYFYIEKPFRNQKKISFKIFMISIILSILSIITLNHYLSKNIKYSKNTSYKVGNINLENIFYKNEKDIFYNKFKKQKFSELDKRKKILIIGNSHARDLFCIFKLNSENFRDYTFIFEWTDVSNILKVNKSDQFYRLKDNILNADLVILSSSWTKKDLVEISKTINYLKSLKKEILISTGNPIFTNFYKTGFERSFTILDKFLYKEKRLPNFEEDLVIKKIYYESYINNKSNFRKLKNLEEISNKHQVKILNQISLICNNDKKECKYLTSGNNKIFYDDDHITLSGAKYLGSENYNITYFSNLLK